jgi:hypothetical protein
VLAAADDSRSARTSRSRQQHFTHTFLPYVKLHHDPWLLSLSAHEAGRVFAAYAVFLALGHTLRCKTIMSSTIKAYLRLAATTVADGRKRFRDSNPHRQLTWIYPLRDPYEATTRWYRSITVVCDEVERWEKLTDLKEPVTIAMVHDLHQQQDALTPFGLATVIYDWTVVGMYIGTRLSEWAQQDGVTSLPQVALTDDGDPIAFTIHDVAFFGLGRRQLQLSYALTHLTEIITATIRWRTQKNKRKGEKKTLVRAPS